jgi:hypothetical protein
LPIDGVTLINQSTAEAARFPYTITEPGSYKLSGNLIAPSGKQAIVVAASNASIDLNGFTVSCTFPSGGPSSFLTCIGDGAVVGFPSGISDVTIRNGSVTVSVTGTVSSSVAALGFPGTPNTIFEETHLELSVSATNAFVSFLTWGMNSIIRHNVLSATGPEAGNAAVVNAVGFFTCPVLLIENINSTVFAKNVNGNGCVIRVNNFGL